MNKVLLFSAIILCASLQLFAQSNSLDTKLKKAYEDVKNGKLDEAEYYLDDLVKKNPSYGDGWTLLAQVRYMQYQKSKETPGLGQGLKISTRGSDGKPVTDGSDSLAKQLEAMLNKIDRSKMAYSKFEYTLRKATLVAPEAWGASSLMRILFVDPVVDSNVGTSALRYFSEGEQEFEQKNYNKAALLYKRALEVQPDFYKASLYLGDCYYATENYKDALEAFKASVKRFPKLLEPRKYLSDVYAKLNAYDNAAQAAVEGMTIYPDVSLAQKLEDALYLNHQVLNIAKTQRSVFPNRIEDTNEDDINTYHGDTLIAKGPWLSYVEGGSKVKSYCNKKGLIVKANKLTSAKYMEVYCWEEMLKNSNDSTLNEARKMQKANYLDCYVLISCFHHDVYDQYLDLVTNHRDKVLAYYKAFTKYQ